MLYERILKREGYDIRADDPAEAEGAKGVAIALAVANGAGTKLPGIAQHLHASECELHLPFHRLRNGGYLSEGKLVLSADEEVDDLFFGLLSTVAAGLLRRRMSEPPE